MARENLRLIGDHQKELVKIFRSVSGRHGLWKVFKDFVAMCAFAISNSVDKLHFDEREADYMRIVGQYTREEVELLCKGLGHVTLGLEQGMGDFLGSLFMSLELGDAWKGQFFTPYEISKLMAVLSFDENTKTQIEQRGFVTMSDPCIGGGAMVIAAADAMQEKKINYQQHLHAAAIDIDIVSVHMSYIQLSLLHIPAIIYHGNSLSQEIWSAWKTPAHILGGWDFKLRKRETSSELVELLTTPTPMPEQFEDPISVSPLVAHPFIQPIYAGVKAGQQASLF